MSLKLNETAPNFTLLNTLKKEVKLNELKGKNVVLLFFPLAFTGVCTNELCSVRDSLADYNQLNATIFGISVDSLFTLAKYKEEQKLNFELLSDFNKNVSLDYNCLYENFAFGMKGVSKRSAFVIDKNGILKHIEILENAGELPNFETIKTVLKNLN
ncbi:MAG: redoxin domain-containing protein [Bacteroidetes bacterium]|nr:redoxin domain-containing protein [Bacteroidota bacterium]